MKDTELEQLLFRWYHYQKIQSIHYEDKDVLSFLLTDTLITFDMRDK